MKHLNLPYDKSTADNIDEDYKDMPITPEEIEFDKKWDEYFEQKRNLNYLRKNIQNYMMNMKNNIIVVYKIIRF